MFLGAYWAHRSCSREAAAALIAKFLRRLAADNAQLAEWFPKKGRGSATDAVPNTEAAIATMLKVNRTDVDHAAMPDLGFILGLWNGGRVSLRITIGAVNSHITNCVVITESGKGQISDQEWKRALSSAIEVFDPEHAVVARPSLQRERSVRNPWDAGWLVYDKSEGLQEHAEDR